MDKILTKENEDPMTKEVLWFAPGLACFWKQWDTVSLWAFMDDTGRCPAPCLWWFSWTLVLWAAKSEICLFPFFFFSPQSFPRRKRNSSSKRAKLLETVFRFLGMELIQTETDLAKFSIMSQKPKSTKQLLLPAKNGEQFCMFTFPQANLIFNQL